MSRHLFLLVFFLQVLFLSPISSQPFLNSLAVLFRARPPWPTTYPASTANPATLFSLFPNSFGAFTKPKKSQKDPNSAQDDRPDLAQFGPSSLVNLQSLLDQSSAASINPQQGIFVAHPISAHNFPQTQRPRPPKFSSDHPAHSKEVKLTDLQGFQGFSNGFQGFPNGFQGFQGFHSQPAVTVIKTSSSVAPPPPPPPPPPSPAPPSPPPPPPSPSSTLLPPAPPPPSIKIVDPPSLPSSGPVAAPLNNFRYADPYRNYHGFRAIINPNAKKQLPPPQRGLYATSSSIQSQSFVRKTPEEAGESSEETLKPTPTPQPFRPSPQISTYYEKTIVQDPGEAPRTTTSGFEASEAKNGPRFESGFRPVNYLPVQYAPRHPIYTQNTMSSPYSYPPHSSPYMSTLPMSTTTSRNEYTTKSGGKKGKKGKKKGRKGRRRHHKENRKFLKAFGGDLNSELDASNSEQWSGVSTETSSSSEEEEEVMDRGGTTPRAEKQTQVAASSSERIEDWLPPRSSKGSKGGKSLKAPVYLPGNKKSYKDRLRPSAKCEKFHRFGFCPVTSNYPLAHVEAISNRCSALLAHLIAPLPKSDVRYDIMVSKNNSLKIKGRTARRISGARWSWKSYKGKPVCDTEEIKVVPGWAKNEKGEWLVILQTHMWKQEAQISLCSPPGLGNCFGLPSEHCDGQDKVKGQPTKICVQRFTAQRLAVLDPENSDRCPVIRSVFLPSACVCLSDNPHPHPLKVTHPPSVTSVTSSANRRSDDNITKSNDDGDPLIASSSIVNSAYAVPLNPANQTYVVITEKYTVNEGHGGVMRSRGG